MAPVESDHKKAEQRENEEFEGVSRSKILQKISGSTHSDLPEPSLTFDT